MNTYYELCLLSGGTFSVSGGVTFGHDTYMCGER
jgi:hypothetical protein